MRSELVHYLSPEEQDLGKRRAELAILQAELTDRELSLAGLRAELAAFEGRYLREAGVLDAELDAWNAKIAEFTAEAAGRVMAIQRKDMRKHRKQFARTTLVLTFTLIPVVMASALLLTPLLAQARTPVQLQAGDVEAEPSQGTVNPYPALLEKAKAGDPSAQFDLAGDYASGEGMPQDDAQAVYWYRRSAKQGDADAQSMLGTYYDQGIGVQRDQAQAAAWTLRAAEQGHADAQTTLGVDYAKGKGVPHDDVQASIWYRKAAEQNDAEAQYWLGEAYRFGHGVPQDYKQAEAWFAKAANNGVPEARDQLSAVQKSLSAIQNSQRERLHHIVGAVIGASLVAVLAVMLIRRRKKLVGYGKTLIPKTTQARQLAVLLPVATWCSACCLYQAVDPRLMRHPINAAVTALLFSTPALIFGAVALWWLSPNKQND